LDGQVAADAVVGRIGQVRIAVVFRFDEIRQHFVVGPAVVAHGGPTVVVAPVAAHVQHVVEDGGSAEHFAARPRTPVEMRLEIQGSRGFNRPEKRAKLVGWRSVNCTANR